ncbi:MAG: HigA family addiction module antidote protein [Rhodospirillales bacterium]|nr:MAG: HigA family addiction module antidote protein [Rhodospirillales bacterium]
MTSRRKPVHPGRILLQEILEPAKVSRRRLARATGLSRTRVGEIVRGRRRVTAEVALRLEEALGVSARTWMNLQTLHDLERASLAEGTRIARSTQRLDMGEAT